MPVEAKVAAIFRPTWPDLPEPADDQLAVAVDDQVDRPLERVAEAVRQRVERARLVVQDLPPELEACSVLRPSRIGALASHSAPVKLDADWLQRLGSHAKGERMAKNLTRYILLALVLG